jgi:hypothetical protein
MLGSIIIIIIIMINQQHVDTLSFGICITFQNTTNEWVYCSNKQLALRTVHGQCIIYSETSLTPQNNLVSIWKSINTDNFMWPVCGKQRPNLKKEFI